MKKLQSAVFIMTLLLAAPAFAYLGLSCNPEDKPTYEGVDCSQCHGPGADWDSLCGAFNPAKAIRIEYESPRGWEVLGSGSLRVRSCFLTLAY